jgi:UDP-N-acetylmuramoyl-L-alanyl-D-glutamate--2,6-diaminopimelate ligase
MKQLVDILTGYNYQLVQGNENVNIIAIHFDSRKVKSGDLFVAIPGEQADGHEFISKAIELGAKSIICEQVPENVDEKVTIVKVADSRDALAYIANRWYDNPSGTMKVIGVTGTNGKTTTATMLYNVFYELGFPCGLFSTVKILIDGDEIEATHTTPDPLSIQKVMSQMRGAGCEFCFMEVSSHAVDQKRVNYIDFDAGVFTNITQDHLDYHKTFKNYIEAKQAFFTSLSKDAFAIYNSDDKNGTIMVQNSKAQKISYALKRPADFKVKLVKKEMGGMELEFNGLEMWSMLTGEFNAYNLMAVYATASQFFDEEYELLSVLSKQKPVRGRFEHIVSLNGVHAIIDYAHTPDAVENVLSTIDDVRTGDEQLIVVIGAGGDRDKTKRPIMAEKACKYANTIVFTSDNPRNEEPGDIINDMKAGIPADFTGKEFTIESREEAIKVACSLASPKDIILVAGKGHETYQEVKGVRNHFDDKEIIKKYLK